MGAYPLPHPPEIQLAQGMTDQQAAMYLSQYSVLRKDAVAAVLLAFFLGSFGAHRFYLRQNGLGILYFVFFWTGIPAIVAFVECFLMPGRVRDYNLHLAALIAGNVRSSAPFHPQPVNSFPGTALSTSTIG